MTIFYAVLITLGALILSYGIWCLAEPFFLDLDRAVLKDTHEDRASFSDISVKSLPLIPEDIQDDPDVRLFFISDIHSEWCPVSAKRISKAIEKCHKSAPLDAVIFGGDIASRTHNAAGGFKYLRKISDCCKELGIPFYGVCGNHDYAIAANAPAASGFISLDNKVTDLISHKTGAKISLAGHPNSGRHNRVWQQTLPEGSHDPVILVAHDPEALIHIDPSDRPAFMLSGHLHGGQMKLPFRLQFTALRKADCMPGYGVVQGCYNIMGTSVFVSRGLGCGVLPVRFLSLPEATVVDIHL